MQFQEPLWKIVHPAEYEATRRRLLADWIFFGSVTVTAVVALVALGNQHFV